MAFRWRPRPPPPKPPVGKNVIPFPSDRVTPPGGRSLGDIEPSPPINLKEIRRLKALQDAADIMPEEGTSKKGKFEVEGFVYPDALEELRRLDIEQGVTTKEREQRRSLREQQGLSGLGEEVPVKTDIEKYGDVLKKQKRSERRKGLNNFIRDIVIYYNSSREPLKNLSLESLVEDLNDIRELITTDQGVPISVKRIEKLRAVYDKIFKEVKVRRIKEAQERKKTPKQIKRLDVIKQRVKDKFTKALGPIEDYPSKQEMEKVRNAAKYPRGKEGELEEALIKLSETTEAAKRKTLLRDILKKYPGVSPSEIQDAYDGIYKRDE